MARLTISEAIRQSPIGRTSFYTKYIDTGIITVSESNQGKRYIDSSELVRVFGDSLTLSKPEHSKDNRKVTAHPDTNASEQYSEQSLLVAQLRTQIEDLKEDKEHYRQQIKDLTLRLEPPAPAAPSNPIIRWWRGLG